MQDFTWRGLFAANFDKVLLMLLFMVAYAGIIMLAHWNLPQEIIIRFEDAFSAILGALIALVTTKHDTTFVVPKT